MHMTRRDALRGLLALCVLACTAFTTDARPLQTTTPASVEAAQLWPPVWFWDNAFTPAKLPGLQLWLRADQGVYQDSALTTPAVASSDPVGGWGDQSGRGNTPTQTTAGNRPTLQQVTNNGTVFWALRFDGTNDALSRASFPYGIGTGDWAFFVVAAPSNPVPADGVRVVALGEVDQTPSLDFAKRSSKLAIEGYDGVLAPTISSTANWTADQWVVWSARRLGTTWEFWRNGVTQGTTTNASSFATASGVLEVGRDVNGTSFWKGDIAAVVLSNQTVSMADMQRAARYFGQRVGVVTQ